MDRSAFSDFDGLNELVRRTHGLLDALVDDGRLEPDAADYLADATLPHLEAARNAFRTWLRAEMADTPELQYLIRQGGVIPDPPSGAAERHAAQEEARFERVAGLRSERLTLDTAERRAFTALSHARIVMGLMPRTPDEDVRLRMGRRTYADIPVPRGPAELASRIEELERQLWGVAVARRVQPLDPAFRRTYGFFDVAERMARRMFRLH